MLGLFTTSGVKGSTGNPIKALYMPERVVISIAGVHTLEGMVEGTFVQVQRLEDEFTSRVSTDGVVTRTKSNNELFRIQFTLMDGSFSNDVLQNLAAVDRLSGRGRFPIVIKDTLGGSMLVSSNTWIERAPDLEFATDSSDRVWTLMSAYAIPVISGNDTGESGFMDVLSGVMGGFSPVGLLDKLL